MYDNNINDRSIHIEILGLNKKKKKKHHLSLALSFV